MHSQKYPYQEGTIFLKMSRGADALACPTGSSSPDRMGNAPTLRKRPSTIPDAFSQTSTYAPVRNRAAAAALSAGAAAVARLPAVRVSTTCQQPEASGVTIQWGITTTD